MKDQDRDEWERAWRSMEHRRVPDPSTLGFEKLVNSDFGIVESAAITEAPSHFVDFLYFSKEECALCSRFIEGHTQKIPASLSLDFERIKNLGICVWVHRRCFEALPVSYDPASIPW